MVVWAGAVGSGVGFSTSSSTVGAGGGGGMTACDCDVFEGEVVEAADEPTVLLAGVGGGASSLLRVIGFVRVEGNRS